MSWTVSSIIKTMLPILTVLTCIEISTGLVLSSYESTLFQYPSLLILVPVTIGTAGSLGSTLSARLSTSFHLGLLDFNISNYHLTGNILSTIALSITIFPFIGALSWISASVVFVSVLNITDVVIISTLSGIFLSIFASIVALAATYSAYRFKLDPDDVAIPFVTNLCDFFGIIILLALASFII